MGTTPSERFLKNILPKGFTTARSGRGKHIRIVCPDGEILRDKNTNMPITISSTPAGSNWENRIKHSLEKVIELRSK